MNKKHTHPFLLLVAIVILSSVITSCKKSSDGGTPVVETVVPKPLATIGLIQAQSSTGTYRRIFIGINQVGTTNTQNKYYGVFDTGSTGLTIDADGLIPASMITNDGITFTGDSVTVNGITIKGKPLIMAYGDNISSTKEYGYLAYSTFTIGDVNGVVATKRIPFFLYYKVVDQTGNKYAAHSSDVFGVGPGTSYASTAIASPLSYFDMPAGTTNGFKLATVGNLSGYTPTGTYAPGVLTIGLVPKDLTSSGFIMHPFTVSGSSYTANIPATITYGGKTITGQILFDTGTPSLTVIEDRTAAIGTLPVNTTVTITTNKGFVYSYVTQSTYNLTEVQNPNNTLDTRTIFALDFFFTNQYLTDYQNRQIGLKGN